MKILIADDDEDQLAIRKMLFDQAGFDTVVASAYETAIEAARNTHPACALVDLRFPDEKTGLKLIRDLKLFNPCMRVFVLTGGSLGRLKSLRELSLVEAIIAKGTPSPQLIRRLQQACAGMDAK